MIPGMPSGRSMSVAFRQSRRPDRMRRASRGGAPSFTVVLALLAGCASPPPVEVSSTRFDHIECSAVVAQRDALRAQYPVLPPDRGERMPMGGFAPLRDVFESASSETKARAAKGQI